ncbi:MAG: DUF485 domain-containing protein [Gammaproteobacteria bacterium]|nr:DUF485 domain-containing protein [Gammaproteobacteria bacterium]
MAYSKPVFPGLGNPMRQSWLYASIVLLLFALLVVGIPLFPETLAIPVTGGFNLGALIFLVLHLLAPALAFVYLKQRRLDS